MWTKASGWAVRGALPGIVIALVGPGCGGSDNSDDPGVSRSKPEGPAAVTAAPKPGSASATVRRYWTYLQEGALPGALALYDPAVNKAIGVRDMSGALSSLRPAVTGVKLNVVKVERARKGALVRVEPIQATGKKTRESFYLRRGQDRRWRLRYDSLTAEWLQRYVQKLAQYRIDPTKTPSLPAIKVGDVTQARFRAVGLR